MVESKEHSMELNLSLSNNQNDNQIEKYSNFENKIETINQTGRYGNVALHVVTYRTDKEVVQLFLTNSAFKSLENISHQSTTYNESKINEINKLLLTNCDLLYVQNEIPDNDDIEWSLTGNNLVKKRKEFREQIDVYKTYDNQHPSITQLLFEIIEYYINEYLVHQENFSKSDAEELGNYFKQAIEEKNYFKYFIQAYTSANNLFHRVLNKHLALYILDYFDPQSYSTSRTKYRLINCLAHIVTLIINHPGIDKYKYKGITYRGILMNKNDLKSYSVGNHILNRSFVSTSKNRSIAQLFADNSHSGETSDHHESTQVPVLIKYRIKQNETAIDIESISKVPDEEEVLILPFSVFQVKDKIESCPNMCSPMLVEIDLEECEDDEQRNNEKKKNEPPASLRDQIRKRRNVIIIGLCVMIGLFVALGLYVASKVATNPKDLAERKLVLVWEDDFNSNGTVDHNKWAFDVGGHGWYAEEIQYYTQNRTQNARCENFPGSQNGRLIIEAHKETYDNNNFTSARLRSKNSWTYGRLQIRALLPSCRGLFSVFELLPEKQTYGTAYWPDNGDIDLMLHRGYDPLHIEVAVNTKAHGLLTKQPINKVRIPDVTTNFKVYTLTWNDHELEMFVGDDDNPFQNRTFFWPKLDGNWTRWPFDKPFYVLFYIAVGGTWAGKDIDESIFPCRMEIDWIRYYQ